MNQCVLHLHVTMQHILRIQFTFYLLYIVHKILSNNLWVIICRSNLKPQDSPRKPKGKKNQSMVALSIFVCKIKKKLFLDASKHLH